MSVKTFQNNGKNIRENIVKLKQEKNIKSLLHNHSVDICAEQTNFDSFVIRLPDKIENPLNGKSQN